MVEARLRGSVSHDSTHRIQVDLKPLPRPDGRPHEVSRSWPEALASTLSGR
ncbi:hypothetical protein [Streptomyces sp. KM273126]|uniref:hypothetical protein n=1 Tax=Streptomyces sp. KM273126 TaxID=2545247 RepID=UPI0037DA5D75